MTDLITEARELCELRRKQKHIPMSMLDKMLELCDALEKAEGNLDAVWGMYQSAERELKKVQEQNKKLVHELSKLACESVERDRALARLEAEVMARCAPTADVAPVVHGEWLFIANGVEAPECSVCGWAVPSRDFENRSGLPPYHKYCGHCGAKMERSDT